MQIKTEELTQMRKVNAQRNFNLVPQTGKKRKPVCGVRLGERKPSLGLGFPARRLPAAARHGTDAQVAVPKRRRSRHRASAESVGPSCAVLQPGGSWEAHVRGTQGEAKRVKPPRPGIQEFLGNKCVLSHV